MHELTKIGGIFSGLKKTSIIAWSLENFRYSFKLRYGYYIF